MRIASLVGLVAALAVLAGGEARAADLSDIEGRGSLRVLAVSFDGLPDFMAVNNFDLDLIEGFARLHELELEVIPVASYADLIPSLLAGHGDVIACGLTDTVERRERVAFSRETFPSSMVLVTRRPHRVIETSEDLGNERFGTEKGTSWAQATHALGVPPERVDDSIPMQELPSALESGRITAAVFEVHVAMPAATRDPELQLGAFVGEPGSLAWAVRKADTRLLASLNEYLSAVRRTPTWHRLVVSHFGGDAAQVLKRSRGER